MECFYIGIFEHSNLIGVSLAQYLDLNKLESFGERDKCIKTLIRNFVFKNFASHTLFLGNNMITGQNGYSFLKEIDLGIMPLEDTPFNRGKCGFKLIQYMAMGKPTLSTPLEANVKINRNNNNLFAISKEEWVICINKFISDISFYREVGLKNQKIVEKYYSVEANSISYIKIFNQLINVRN